MSFDPSAARQSYLSTFVVDGQPWPFTASAVVVPETVEADRRRIVTGEMLRVVTVPPLGVVRRASKEGQIRVTFDDLPFEWLKRLQNLKDQNKPFSMQMLAFDAQMASGVPMYSTTPMLTSIESPRNVTAADSTGGALTAGSAYSYRVSAVIGGVETAPCPSVLWQVGATKNAVALSWGHIPSVTSYRIYGRTPSLETFMIEQTPAQLGGGSTPAAGATLTFTDLGSVAPGPNPSGYTVYAVANERRWSDNPAALAVIVSGVSRVFDTIDHNGVTIPGGASYCTIDTRAGTVTMNGPQTPCTDVRVLYVWEPRVAIDDIDSQSRPTAYRPNGEMAFAIYSPIVTLSILL